MNARKLLSKFTPSYLNYSKYAFCRRYSSENNANSDDKSESSPAEIISKTRHNTYKVFVDKDSPIIFDIEEERRLMLENPELLQELQERQTPDKFFGMNLKRGVRGVFDVEELVTLLQNDNAQNVVTIAVPPEYRYVDQIVIVSGRSMKHLFAMAELIRKLFKKKRLESDIIPRLEGTLDMESSGWLAIDLGNIALHLFLEPTRKKYDLETLWSVGREFDDLYNSKEDDYLSLLQQHTFTDLNDLTPINNSNSNLEEKLA